MGDPFQQPGHDPAGQHEHAAHDQQRLAERPERLKRRTVPAAQHGHQQHHGHAGQVLKDQHGHGQAADHRVGLLTIAEHAQHHRRTAADRHQKARKKRRTHIDAQRQRQPEHDQGGQSHLQPASQEQFAPDAPELVQLELDADREQQQDDADLGRVLDERLVADQPQHARSDQHAGQQKPHDRHQPDLIAQIGDHDARHHERHQLPQKR